MRINSYQEAITYITREKNWIDSLKITFSIRGINSDNRPGYINYLRRFYQKKLTDLKVIKAYKPSPFELVAKLIMLLYMLKHINHEKSLQSGKIPLRELGLLADDLGDVLEQYGKVKEENIDYLKFYLETISCINKHREALKSSEGCVITYIGNIRENLAKELKKSIEDMKSEWRLKASHPVTLWSITNLSRPIRYFRDVESPDIHIVTALKTVIKSLSLLYALLSVEIALDTSHSAKTLKQTKASALLVLSQYLSETIESQPEQRELRETLEAKLSELDKRYFGWREGVISHRVNSIVQMLLAIVRDLWHVSYEPMRNEAAYFSPSITEPYPI